MMKTYQLGICAALSIAAIAAGSQAIASAEPVPPHIAAARKLAFEGDKWAYPALIMCYPEENRVAQQVLKIPPPTKAFDNLYNVGIGGVTAWAITTSEGIIIIDALNNPKEAEQYIIGGLKELGLDPNDIKYVIVTHGHADHYGGARWMQDTYPGLHVLMSEVDYETADKRAANGRFGTAQPPHRDQVVTDGQTLTLGDQTITFYITPGHTPGTLSMLIPVKDHGVPHLMAFWGGTASGNASPTDPYQTQALHQAYDESTVRFSQIVENNPVDGLLSNHPSLDDAAGKLEHLRETPDMPNPFVTGKESVLRWLGVVRECNLSNTEVDARKEAQKR